MKKKMYILFGCLFLAFGTLGIVLPILPTTPFYLLTAWFFMRGSDRLYARVMGNKYFGKIVSDYYMYRAIPLKSKILAILVLWISISISAYVVSIIWVRILLLLVAIGVTVHLLLIKTLKK